MTQQTTPGDTPNSSNHTHANGHSSQLQVETQQPQQIVVAPPRGATFDLTPTNMQEALQLADYFADSSMVPKDYIGKPGNVLVAIQWGLELGLKPLQAMQNIAVINGRPSLWGDAVLALVQSSPVCVDVVEFYEGEGNHKKAICIAKRKGREDKVGEFSVADADKAGLLTKSGPWSQYRDRMLKMRARAFALRDQFADVLKGMPIAEEVGDIPSDNGPSGHLNTGSSAPRLPASAKGSQIAESTRPALTEEGAAVIVTLTRTANTEGFAAAQAAWKAQPDNIRAQIGKNKRDEIFNLGADFDAGRKDGATDATYSK